MGVPVYQTAYQASQRGGFLQLVAAGDRVRIGGNAVTVFKGEMIDRGGILC